MPSSNSGAEASTSLNRGVPVGAANPPRLDQVDIELLKALATDARLSQRALGRAVNMSPPAVADRVARLEEAGVIQGYRAVLNYELLNLPMTVVVGVTCERSAEQREMAQRFLQIPEVERVEIVTGGADLQVRMRVRNQAHLNEVFFERFLALQGLRHTETALAMLTFAPDNFAVNALEMYSDARQL